MILHSTHEADLDLPGLPTAACHGHIVPALATQPLLSVGQLCDARCDVTFTADTVTISHNNAVVMQGQQTPSSKLWELNIRPTPTAHANAAVGSASPADLIAFAHAALFSPVLSTLAEALHHGHIPEFAGLTLDALQKYPPQSEAMIKGHLDQTHMNQRSTKLPSKTASSSPPHNTDAFPPALEHGDHTHFCYAAMIAPAGQTHMDLTGKFVAPSSAGNNYILIVYDYDSNGILAVPLPNWHAESILQAYQVAHAQLCATGLRPKLQRLDNKASQALQEFLTSEDMDYQLVPPHVHRRNAAERAICTFKNHFIAGLCTTDKNFPIHLWDCLIPQAEITLNLLRGSQINSHLSAWAQLHGPFGFNRTPIAPPGTRVIIHEKPNTRRTWAPHGIDGWYLGPTLNSYHCYTMWANDTKAQRITDTLVWLPSKIPMPTTSSIDYILLGMTDIIHALQHPLPNSPLAPLNDSQTKALQLLMLILHGTTNPNQPPVAPASPLRVTCPTKKPANTSSVTPPPTATPAASLRVVDLDAHPDDVTIPTNNCTTSRHQPPPVITATAPTPPRMRHQRRPRRSKRLTALHACQHLSLDSVPHAALHGNAFNPNTGELAEYKELSNSSDGSLWQHANATEIH